MLGGVLDESSTRVGSSGVTVGGMSIVCGRTGAVRTFGTDRVHTTKAGGVGDAVGCNGVLDDGGATGASVVTVGCNSVAIKGVVDNIGIEKAEDGFRDIGEHGPHTPPRRRGVVCYSTPPKTPLVGGGRKAAVGCEVALNGEVGPPTQCVVPAFPHVDAGHVPARLGGHVRGMRRPPVMGKDSCGLVGPDVYYIGDAAGDGSVAVEEADNKVRVRIGCRWLQ